MIYYGDVSVSQLRNMLAIMGKEDSVCSRYNLSSLNITKDGEKFYFDVTNGAVASRTITTDAESGGSVSGDFPRDGVASIPRELIENFLNMIPKGKKVLDTDVQFTFGDNNTVTLSVNDTMTCDYTEGEKPKGYTFSLSGVYSTDTEFLSFDKIFKPNTIQEIASSTFALFTAKNTSLFEDFLKCNYYGRGSVSVIRPYGALNIGGLIAFVGPEIQEDTTKEGIEKHVATFIMMPCDVAKRYSSGAL